MMLGCLIVNYISYVGSIIVKHDLRSKNVEICQLTRIGVHRPVPIGVSLAALREVRHYVASKRR